jgi:pilus assembly protein CpaF
MWIQFLRACVGARLNIIVSGGTGVGKTTFLNLLLGELTRHERVITIEDTIELSLNIPNVVRLESGGNNLASKATLSIRDLVKNTLRMRPDRIIIGEVRGGEMFDLLQAMNTGHEGSMTSIHANSPGECLGRIETIYLLAGFDIPYHVIRRQMTRAIDLIIQIGRNHQGKRIVTHIAELTGMEKDVITMQPVALYNEKNDNLVFTGNTLSKIRKLHEKAGLPLDFFNHLPTT